VTGPADGDRIVVTLRDGSEHVLELEQDTSAAHVFDEVSAGRSQLLRGWVAVVPTADATQAVVSGEEIVKLRLAERSADGGGSDPGP
jgi:hypothetical protein